MPKLPVVKSKEMVKVLRKMAFLKFHQVGSHAQFKHQDGRRTTVPIHSGKEITRGTLKAILKDINISVEEFIEILRSK